MTTAQPSSVGVRVAPKDLYLSECRSSSTHINSDASQMLPNDAESWDRIKVLDLSRNCLGRKGMLPFIPVISTCTMLIKLNLSDNYLSNDFVVQLCATLAVGNHRLMSLNLSKNPISYPAGKALVKLIAAKPFLCEVIVDQTLMNPGLAKIVSTRAAENGVKLRKEAAVSTPLAAAGEEEGTIFQAIMNSSPKARELGGLSALGDVHREVKRDQHGVNAAVAPDDDWYAMETMWNLAAAAAPRDDGWAGLASVMALVRQDISLASLY